MGRLSHAAFTQSHTDPAFPSIAQSPSLSLPHSDTDSRAPAARQSLLHGSLQPPCLQLTTSAGTSWPSPSTRPAPFSTTNPFLAASPLLPPLLPPPRPSAPRSPRSGMTTSHEARAARRASGALLGKEDDSAMSMDAAALEAVGRVPLSPTGRSSRTTSTTSTTSTISTSPSASISSSEGSPTSEIGAASSSLTTETPSHNRPHLSSSPKNPPPPGPSLPPSTTTVIPSSFASTTHTTTTTTITASTHSTSSSSSSLPPIINPRRLSGAGSHENFSPQVIQRLAREVRELMTSPPEGVTFVPNDEESLMKIHVEIQGPVGTPYEEGVFRLKLVLSRNYPHSPPKAFFFTKIYHPNVAWSGGDVCVDVLKRSWSADITLEHTLQVIRCLLIEPFPESSLNDEAGRLFMLGYEEYARRAKLYTNVHAKVLLAAAPASPKYDCKASAAEAGGGETVTGSDAGKGFAAKGGSSSLSLSAAMRAGGEKSGGDREEGEEKGVASTFTQQQRSKEARRKSLKRL